MREQETLQPEHETGWQRLRADFPVTERLAYFNSAGAGPVPRAVFEAATQLYRETLEGGDARWFEWLERRERARAALARFINADPSEIAFTTNTSSGMNLIVDALEGRGEVISCELEFPVSTLPWMHRGMTVNLVKAVGGELRTEDVRGAMTDKTSIICLSHVQYSNGFRADLEELGANKGRHLFVVNASQSAGVFPVDVKRMRIDALCATGHKWMLAGYGSGFCYMSRELLDRTRPRAISWMSVEDPFKMRNDAYDIRADAGARSETGCPPFAGIFALGAATQYLLDIGPQQIAERALHINRRLTERLRAAGWEVLSPLRDEATRSAETLVATPHPKRVVKILAGSGVAVTIKPQGIRIATHFFNNEDDITRLIQALEQARERSGIET
ncbi:MAG TPA: aminotransferase class V-fold PLP-dependent enzyme [Pyrinomonadaceae bacterium]|jgi:selenocysteine lyase/cysteine desulfurase|nr:aminotransferase class V-fold PLP-dependent enzyme [Pyrinomonadaceae bacterium]